MAVHNRPWDCDASQRRGIEASRHDPLTHRIIGCAIEVHRQLDLGLLEATYQEALCQEMAQENIGFLRQVGVTRVLQGPFDW